MSRLYSIALCFLSISLNAQSLGFEVPVGYSSYSMKDLSRFVHEQADQNPPIKVTNDFPANIHFGFRLHREENLLQEGIEYIHMITGGRVHYKDYSGEIGIDIKAVSHTSGIFIRPSLLTYKQFQFRASLMLGANLSAVDFYQYKEIGTKKDEVKLNTLSWSVAIIPGVEPVFSISKTLYTGLRVGFLVNSPGGLYEEGNRKAKLYDAHDKQVTSQWSGLRGDFYIGFKFLN